MVSILSSKRVVASVCSSVFLFLLLYNSLIATNEPFGSTFEAEITTQDEPSDIIFSKSSSSPSPLVLQSDSSLTPSSVENAHVQPSISPVQELVTVILSPSPKERVEPSSTSSPSSSIASSPHSYKLPQQHPHVHPKNSPSTSISLPSPSTSPSSIPHQVIELPQMPRSEYAYATIVNGPNWQNYFIDTLTLQYSLRYIANVTYPLLAIVEPSMHSSVKEAFRSAGIIVIELPPYGIPRTVHPRSVHWRYSFAKMYLWMITEYKQIIHLDSDVIVLKNLDHLFGEEVKGGLVGPPCWTACEPESLVCGAFFRITPNMTTAQVLNDTLWKTNSSFGGGDLDLFKMVFTEDNPEEQFQMKIMDKNYLVWQMLCSCESQVFTNSTGIAFAATQWWVIDDRACVGTIDRGTNAKCDPYFWCRKKEYKDQAKLLWWNTELFLEKPEAHSNNTLSNRNN